MLLCNVYFEKKRRLHVTHDIASGRNTTARRLLQRRHAAFRKLGAKQPQLSRLVIDALIVDFRSCRKAPVFPPIQHQDELL